MSNIKRFTKRGLSVFLALVMCLSLLPTAAFATGGEAASEPVELDAAMLYAQVNENNEEGAVTVSAADLFELANVGLADAEGEHFLTELIVDDGVEPYTITKDDLDEEDASLPTFQITEDAISLVSEDEDAEAVEVTLFGVFDGWVEEEEPTEATPAEKPDYATVEELETAFEKVGEVLESGDIQAGIDALDEYLDIYNRLSPGDQETNAEALAAAEAYRENLVAAKEAEEVGGEYQDSDIEMLASRATYKGTVTLYGTPENAIKSGPTYGSKVKIDLGTRTGQSWNNVSYTIPQVSEYFTLNDGWTIDYVSVAGNSSGNRQPGASFLLGMSGGSMVYYFKQTATTKTFTLNYNANGGSGAPAAQTQKSTAASYNFTISNTQPTWSGYTFLGWSTNSRATSPSYYGGGSINVSGTTTLYAVWQKNAEKVTLTYSGNGNTSGAVPSAQTVDKGTSVTIKDKETLVREGYEFLGWNTNPKATSVNWSAGDAMTLNTSTTLYAVWKLKAPTDNGNGISITKERVAINGETTKDTAEPGDEITWNITVTNNSNVTKRVTLTEQLQGATLSKNSVTLEAGKSETVTATYTVKAGDKGTTIVNAVVGATGGQGNKENPKAEDEGTSVEPGTTTGNFTVVKFFAGLDTGVIGPQVTLTYEAWRTKDGTMVGAKQAGNVTLTNQANGTYTGTITPTVWDISTSGANAMPENERLRYKNVVVITEDLDSAKVNGYTLKSFAARYSADGKNDDNDKVQFVLDGATYQKDLSVKNTYTKNTPPEIPEDPVSIEKKVDQSTVKVGDTVNYTVKITNETTETQTIKVNDILPEGLKLGDSIGIKGAVSASGSVTGTGAVVTPDNVADILAGITNRVNSFDNLEVTIAAGKTVELTYSATVQEGASGKLTNEATATVGDKTLTATVDVTVKADEPVVDNGEGITVEKTLATINGESDKTVAKVGDEIVWNIKVTNNSNVEKIITLTESLDGATLSKSTVTLASNASDTVTATYTVKDTDAAGKLTNVVIGEAPRPTTENPNNKDTDEGKDDSVEIQKDPEPEKVTITVKFVDENGNEVGTPITKQVEKNTDYNATNDTKQIPEGYEANGNPTGDPITGKADGDKTIIVPVKKTPAEPETPDQVKVTVQFVDENGNSVVTPTPDTIAKDAPYDVTEKVKDIPTGWVRDPEKEINGDPTGTADSDKLITVPVTKDTIGPNTDDPSNPNKPDGIPDKYQVVLKYVAGSNGAVSGDTTKVIELKDDAGNHVSQTAITPGTTGVTTAPNNGYHFDTWTPNPANQLTVQGGNTYTFTASFAANGGGGSSSGNGGGGGGGSTNIPDNPTPLDPGTQITDPDVPLAVAPGLNSTDHFAYIIGYPDGTVRPQGNITRAEVATIFFRLMTDEFRTTNWASTNSFPDVASASLWYNNAVSTAAKAGLLKGKEDGNFHPSQNITRAEFATIAARFLSDEEITAQPFPDTVGHWAEKDIIRAVQAGWIKGDSDGNFRPNDPITRAEAMTLVNRMLDRVPDKDHMLSDMVTWPDNPESAWFYEAVQEATNSHDYERDELGVTETWTGKLADRDWSALEKEWSDAASSTGSNVADNLQK